jgi:hypothetical protein
LITKKSPDLGVLITKKSPDFFILFAIMKRFLMSNPNNKKWIEAQESIREAQSNVEAVSHLVRREMFP